MVISRGVLELSARFPNWESSVRHDVLEELVLNKVMVAPYICQTTAWDKELFVDCRGWGRFMSSIGSSHVEMSESFFDAYFESDGLMGLRIERGASIRFKSQSDDGKAVTLSKSVIMLLLFSDDMNAFLAIGRKGRRFFIRHMDFVKSNYGFDNLALQKYRKYDLEDRKKCLLEKGGVLGLEDVIFLFLVSKIS